MMLNHCSCCRLAASFFKFSLPNAVVYHAMIEFSHQFSGSKLPPNLRSEVLPLSLAFLLQEHESYMLSQLVSVFISFETNEVKLLGTNAIMSTHVAWQLQGGYSDDPECAHMNFLKD